MQQALCHANNNVISKAWSDGPAPAGARTAARRAKIAGTLKIYVPMTTAIAPGRRCLVSAKFGVFYFYKEQQKESHALRRYQRLHRNR
jgi:hypothetical protein